MLSTVLLPKTTAMTTNVRHVLVRSAILLQNPLLKHHYRGCASSYHHYFSTEVTATRSTKEEPSASKCPFSASSLSQESRRVHSTAVAADAVDRTPSAGATSLQHAPAWPLVGSTMEAIPGIGPLIQTQVYGLPIFDTKRLYDVYYQLYKSFGSFYTIGIIGVGTGVYHTTYILNDAQEMKRVIRMEGKYPKGGVESLDFFKTYMQDHKWALRGDPHDASDKGGLLGRGKSWRRYRDFIQKDLMAPQSARGYVPGVVEAASVASRVAPLYASNMNAFFNVAAFDMFQAIMFGHASKAIESAARNTPDTGNDKNSPSLDDEFIQMAIVNLGCSVDAMQNPIENLKHKMGIKTPLYRKFEQSTDRLHEIVSLKLQEFQTKFQEDRLNEKERNSYFFHALERFHNGDEGSLSQEELSQIGMLLLNASVDTTATFLCWALVHLALNPGVQEALYHEQFQNVHSHDNDDNNLTANLLSKAKSPYLHAILRESHRLTPVAPATMIKSIVEDMEIHGELVPKGSSIMFDSYSLGVDPEIVPNPQSFEPTRWLDESIEARKGTPAEGLDHVFYREPFSQGARRCPGSRVAVNETQVLLARLVLDWKITLDEEERTTISSYRDIPYDMQTLLTPDIPKLHFEKRSV